MSTLIHTLGDVGILAGLEWMPLSSYSPRSPITQEVRRLARDHSARKIYVHGVQHAGLVRGTLGMYAAVDPADDEPKNLHPLAVLLVRAYPEAEAIVLLWRLDHDRSVFIVVERGIPLHDEVAAHEKAVELFQDAVAGEHRIPNALLLTNDTETFSECDSLKLETLLAHTSKETRLVAIPLGIGAALGLVAVALVLAAGVNGYVLYRDGVKEAEQRRIEALTDPVPHYQAALAQQIAMMGVTRDSMLDTFKQIGGYAIWADGWLLARIHCTPGQCVSTWARRGGTRETLKKARSHEVLLPPGDNEDEAQTSWENRLVHGGLGTLNDAVSFADAESTNISTYQRWKDAGINVSASTNSSPYVIWPPNTAGDLSRLPSNTTLRVRPIAVTGMPYALFRDLVAETPRSVWWNSFTVKHTLENKDDPFTVDLLGNTYVRD